ncbi:caspase family protein [Kribbella sp. NBC_00382]|uniref:caspase, EACC1-associated type n=1 Tax=Kribbella sp. NBC_00382 TaxID=2975967 RepID=UPI002E1AD274
MVRRLALLIATYEYEDTGLRRLTTPAHDAEALARVLEDREIAGFEVRTLVNASRDAVGEAIAEFYAGSRRDDLTLLYFTGHGLKDDNGRLHLAMSNTKRNSLRFTALAAHLIDEAMSESPSRQKILILDCCYSGSYETQQFAKSDSAVHLETLGGRGRTVLTASDSTQYAFEGSTIHGEAAQSVFTRHLVEGLRDGTADIDGDGDITVDELYSYVYDRVTAEQPNQRPKKLDQVEGRTVIAANVHWTLPAHLTAALENPLPRAREAAVGGLAELRRSGNELVRRTATRRLEELVDDDSRSVSAAARAALDAPGPPTPLAPRPVGSTPVAPAPAVTPPAAPMSVVSMPEGVTVDGVSSRRTTRTARQPAVAAPIGEVPSTSTTRQPEQAAGPKVSSGGFFKELVRLLNARLVPATVPAPIYWLSVLAAFYLVPGAGRAFSVYRLDEVSLWYSVVAAVAACLVIALQYRFGLALVAGTTVVGAVSLVMQLETLTKELSGFGVDTHRLYAVYPLYPYQGQAAAIAAGAVALYHFRGELSLDVRRLRGWRAWTMVGLGGVAALIQLWITFYLTYNASLRFREGVPFPIAAVQILGAVLALAGPLLAVLMRRGRTFLAGWVLAGFPLWVGVYGGLPRFPERTRALTVLLAVWALLAVVVIVGRWRDEAAETGQLSDGARRRRWAIVGIAAMLPVVLGGAIVIVDPRGPTYPVVVAVAVAPGNNVLYAVDSANGKVLKISTTSQRQEGEALKVGEGPAGVLLSPDGRQLYVANARSNSVSVIDVDSWTVKGAPIPVGFEPVDLAWSRQTNRLFVLSEKAATITVVDTEKLTTVGGPVSGGSTPSALATGHDGKFLYVANHDGSTVTVIDAATLKPSRSAYKISGKPVDLSVDQDDDALYVLSEDSYSVVNTNVDSPRPTAVPLPGRSKDAVLTDDGSRYVVLGASSEGQELKDLVTVINTKNRAKVGTAESDGGLARQVAVSRDNQRIYVSGYDFEHNVLIVDATIPKAVGAISLGK